MWYLALGGGPPRFNRDCTCPGLLWIPRLPALYHLPGSHRLWRCLPAAFGSRHRSVRGGGPPHSRSTTPQYATQPRLTHTGFGLLPVRSPLLGECFLFLVVLRCFSSHGALPSSVQERMLVYDHQRVAPFGYLRISARSTTPRSFSQSRHVLHRPQAPRHPPHALPTPLSRRVAVTSSAHDSTACAGRCVVSQHTFTIELEKRGHGGAKGIRTPDPPRARRVLSR